MEVPMNRCVFYLRVSTKRQGESGLGLQAQKSFLNHFYKDHDVIGEFIEVQSGGDFNNRPKLKEAIELCQKENATLCVAKICRLRRNTECALKIYRQLNQRLESCDIPSLDEIPLTLFSALSTRKNTLIQLRTKMALDEKKKRDGEWRKGNQDFKNGNASIKGVQANKARTKLNQNNQRALAFLTNIEIKGKTLKFLADTLNSNGFKSSRGGVFYPSTIKMLLGRLQPQDLS